MANTIPPVNPERDYDGTVETSAAWLDIPSISDKMVMAGGPNGQGQMNAQAVAISARLNYLLDLVNNLSARIVALESKP